MFSLFAEAVAGNVAGVKWYLAHGTVEDLNGSSAMNGFSPLHMACFDGNKEIVSLLLSDPRVNVNNNDSVEQKTPLYVACEAGKHEVANLLLADPRVDASLLTEYNRSALWISVFLNNDPIITSLLMSYKNLGNMRQKAAMGVKKLDVLNLCYHRPALTLINELLKLFNAGDTRTARMLIRSRDDMHTASPAHIFATTVYICDDYMSIKKDADNKGAVRFFSIARRLPLELQMILANRAFDRATDAVPFAQSEREFELIKDAWVKNKLFVGGQLAQ